MKIMDFAHRVSTHETGKRQIDIAQILQLLAIINRMTKGILYSAIKILPS